MHSPELICIIPLRFVSPDLSYSPLCTAQLHSGFSIFLRAPVPLPATGPTHASIQPTKWPFRTLPVPRNASMSCTPCCSRTTKSSRRLQWPTFTASTMACKPGCSSTLRPPPHTKSEYPVHEAFLCTPPKPVLTQVSRCGIYHVSMGRRGRRWRQTGSKSRTLKQRSYSPQLLRNRSCVALSDLTGDRSSLSDATQGYSETESLTQRYPYSSRKLSQLHPHRSLGWIVHDSPRPGSKGHQMGAGHSVHQGQD